MDSSTSADFAVRHADAPVQLKYRAHTAAGRREGGGNVIAFERGGRNEHACAREKRGAANCSAG